MPCHTGCQAFDQLFWMRAGARRSGEGSHLLELHVQWEDGHHAYVPSGSLKKRPHCQLAMIDYYESRIRSRR